MHARGLHRMRQLTHSGAIENRPETTPNSKGGPIHHRESDVVDGADATGRADEATGDRVSDPDAYPRLPPRQAIDDHRGADHPRVDVERVGDPEADEIPRAPLASLRLDGFEIIVRQLVTQK